MAEFVVSSNYFSLGFAVSRSPPNNDSSKFKMQGPQIWQFLADLATDFVYFIPLVYFRSQYCKEKEGLTLYC